MEQKYQGKTIESMPTETRIVNFGEVRQTEAVPLPEDQAAFIAGLQAVRQERKPNDMLPEVINPLFGLDIIKRVQTMPSLVAIADTHLMPRVMSANPDSMQSSTKRDIRKAPPPMPEGAAATIGENELLVSLKYAIAKSDTLRGFANNRRFLKRHIRRNDLMTRAAMRVARNRIEEQLSDTGDDAQDGADIFLHLGDVVDAYGLGGFLSSISDLHTYVANRFDNAQRGDRTGSFAMTFGNHDKGFRGHDAYAGFTGLERQPIDNRTFQEMVNHVRAGYSFESMHSVWKDVMWGDAEGAEREEKYLLHPVQRWYLQRIAVGSQVGAFVTTDELGKTDVVAFLDSELNREGCSIEDLEIAMTQEIGLSPGDKLYDDAIKAYDSDIKRQDIVLHQLANVLAASEESTAVVYSHNPVQMQVELANYLSTRYADTFGEHGVHEYLQKRVRIIGGHYHLKGNDTDEIEGVQVVQGFARPYAGPFADVPSKSGSRLGLQAFSHKSDYAEILTGKVDAPVEVRISSDEITSLIRSVEASYRDALIKKLGRFLVHTGGSAYTLMYRTVVGERSQEQAVYSPLPIRVQVAEQEIGGD